MATIDQSILNMTVFYNRRLGNIVSIATGIQDFNVYFGDQAQDYILIWDSIVLPVNDYVMQHLNDFKIETGALKLINNDLSQFI